MNKMYARELTKEYLIKLGIINITPDGKHIYIGVAKEARQYKLQDGYLAFTAYDSDLFKAIYPVTKCRSAGTVTVPVHRAVYAWYKGSAKASMVVDHINNNKTDNRIDNLQLLTVKDNIWKDRVCDVWELKCNLNKPRSFYEEKVEKYLAEYEQAKLDHNAKLVHALRVNLSHNRARLRYWDSHQN